MYTINKIVGWAINPYNLTLMCIIAGGVWLMVSQKKSLGFFIVAFGVAWLWFWSTPLMCRVVGNALECPYLADGRMQRIEDVPQGDVIELHGGAMGIATNLGMRGEMWYSADRVWMAARLWKSGKAPVIVVSGTDTGESTIGLLEDFGVPTNAIIIAKGPRNTEEEAKFICRSFPKTRVLVVTSAWHMTRTLLMYEKYAPKVKATPVACDFENTVRYSGKFTWQQLLPTDEALVLNRVSLHEWIGIWGYKLFR